MSDVRVRLLLDDPPTRVVALQATGVAREVIERHGAKGDAARWLAGQGTVATALLAAYVKAPEEVLLEMALDRPQGTFSGHADAEGHLRCRVDLPEGPVPDRLVGVLVVRTWHDRRTVYQGQAALDHPDLQEGLQAWLAASQQAPARVLLAAQLDGGELAWAGGLLAERLPVEGAPEPDAWRAALERRLGDAARPAVEAALAGQLGGEEVERLPLVFRCTCSLERVEGTLVALGPEELRKLAEDPGHAEVTCHFCAARYVVPRERLLELAG